MNKLEGAVVFERLGAEMARRGLTMEQVAAGIGMSAKSFRNRMTGKTDFTLPQFAAIQQAFFKDLTMDYLSELRDD